MLGVIVVPLGENDKGISAAELVKNREAISQLAQSSDAQKLMSMLRQHGEVQEAAKAAAGGDVRELMGMMSRLMSSKEGAELVERIEKQAKSAGLN